ncbi:mitochondrial fission regulator 1 isoform X1 [Stegostoma tigrinum]|uniref:mitochondrial fission regulator 1 isoform X1 n=1 Tax=Stegostoma tigrinum TaxID=3053191 RepID=UPI00202ACAF6|nr:mitochondrial fission regulator 1 isoform X1 [Stegostoma tigrinum]XP_048384878.1 mitochondrial fission regulator 1 isoform X1 [Stegostoma tigrinum]XP_048384879.1 mitochondrial fission regulator 1 isoform X1 [Stegostoma tigrinum]XP_048384880.1 mitochondrial fission regulator 1 isoform X1 [Stegostoma tigrinum]
MLLFLVQMIRMMLEYAGIDMDSPFWSNKPYGSSRSIIRRIGSSLPLKPCPRVHFQIFHGFGEADQNSTESDNGAVASLADVAWIVCDQGESFSKMRSEIRLDGDLPKRQASSCPRPISRQASLPNLRNCKKESATPTMASDAALEKINILENELAKLREQIAMIVTIQEQRSPLAVTPGVIPSCAAPPLPPPPPPPLPPSPALQRSQSVIDLIKERRGKKPDSSQITCNHKQENLPNMLDVLKDIDKVKLRSVKKSVDDLKPKPDQHTADPTALIAAALKRKFAHRYKNDHCSENRPSNSNFQAEPPKFGQHMLKPTGKRNPLLETSSQS